MKQPKMLYCDYCGEEVGEGVREYGEPVSCGARECDRSARDDMRAMREEAHEELDRQMGWD